MTATASRTVRFGATAGRLARLPSLLRSLRMYWWPGDNFGDTLSPIVVEHLSRRPTRFSAVFSRRPLGCQLVAIGSHLDAIPVNYRGSVWGSGYICAGGPRPLPHARIHAVRGRLTAERLELSAHCAFGDPGVFVTDVYPGIDQHPSVRLGIIPHFTEYTDFIQTDLARHDDVLVIDARQSPKDVLSAVSTCHRILSSSLHGLIVSDALGIPNHWLVMSNRVTGARFKFADYYSAHNRDCPTPVDLRAVERMTPGQVEKSAKFDVNDVTKMKRQLRDTFPF